MVNELVNIATALPPTRLQPHRFFVAWYGVITLAFTGFSRSMLRLKQHIESANPKLKPENPGSRWPHTTLGALKQAPPLTFEELQGLFSICSSYEAMIQQSESQFEVTTLNWVRFGCRSLEERLEVRPIRFNLALAIESDVPANHRKQVETILAPFSTKKLSSYWHQVALNGHRAGHYRKPFQDTTLVFDWAAQQPDYVEAFIEQVEAFLPGRYAWFSPQSRHVTVRSLSLID